MAVKNTDKLPESKVKAEKIAYIDEMEENIKREPDAEIIPPPKDKAYYDELVPHMEFYDGEKYKEDVFVAVNGKSYLIKRGETVMIPRKVKEVLDNAEKQRQATAKLINREQAKFNSLNANNIL
jgi:hypothetical protein